MVLDDNLIEQILGFTKYKTFKGQVRTTELPQVFQYPNLDTFYKYVRILIVLEFITAEITEWGVDFTSITQSGADYLDQLRTPDSPEVL